MRPLICLSLLMAASTLACIPPGPVESDIFKMKHPEYTPPKSTPYTEAAVGLTFRGTDPRMYILAEGAQLTAYVDSLPRCPYEAVRTIQALGDNQRDAVEKLQIEVHEGAGDAVIQFVAKDTSWVFFKPSTMTEPQVKKKYSRYVCRGTSIRFTEKGCEE